MCLTSRLLYLSRKYLPSVFNAKNVILMSHSLLIYSYKEETKANKSAVETMQANNTQQCITARCIK
jgi:hypothetical protein